MTEGGSANGGGTAAGRRGLSLEPRKCGRQACGVTACLHQSGRGGRGTEEEGVPVRGSGTPGGAELHETGSGHEGERRLSPAL